MASTSEFELTPCQTKALSLLETSQNVFLSGLAGSGKSFLIRHFLKDKSSTLYPLVTSTGAAAILVGGRTLHSFFGLGILEDGVEATVQRALKDRRVVGRLKKAETIIIDEISMISGPTFAAAEKVARLARANPAPWGALRVIAVGDFAQLPPVNRFSSKKLWAFEDPAWQETAFVNAFLKTNLRSKETEFNLVLNDIRQGIVSDRVKAFLSSRALAAKRDLETPRMFARIAETESFNLKKLSEINNESRTFETIYTGRSQVVEQMKKYAPIPERITLKNDAYVMIRQNDPKGAWVNGSLGHIREINDEWLSIELLNGRLIELDKTSFSLQDAEGKVVATATNFPVSLAYATTIHKSQGATLEAAVMNLRSLWEPGHAYVALSRVTSGEGVFLESWSENSIKVDPAVTTFYANMDV